MSLTPEEARELLSEYADGELSPEQMAELEKILSENPDLAFESTQIRNLKVLLEHYEGESGGQRFKEAIMNRVSAEPPPGATPWRGRTMLLFLLATALAAVLLWLALD